MIYQGRYTENQAQKENAIKTITDEEHYCIPMQRIFAFELESCFEEQEDFTVNPLLLGKSKNSY